jgi:hypothetical protein
MIRGGNKMSESLIKNVLAETGDDVNGDKNITKTKSIDKSHNIDNKIIINYYNQNMELFEKIISRIDGLEKLIKQINTDTITTGTVDDGLLFSEKNIFSIKRMHNFVHRDAEKIINLELSKFEAFIDFKIKEDSLFDPMIIGLVWTINLDKTKLDYVDCMEKSYELLGGFAE